MKAVKTIRVVLLVIACICFLVGLVLSKNAAKDISKIKVEITDKTSYIENDDFLGESYNVKYEFTIENNTTVDWYYLEITTDVYDKNDKKLGTLTSTMGRDSSYSSHFLIKSGSTQAQDVIFESSNPSDFFEKMYQTKLSDLRYESVVTDGSYAK